jgi:hypothetical protein
MPLKRPKAGRDYPRDLDEFLKLFGSEQDCFDYLERIRWRDGFNCLSCGQINARFWRMGDGRRRCKECRGETTVTAGTIFHRTRKPLRNWFFAIWMIMNSKNGASAVTVQRTLGFRSYETAWAWLHKLRRAMATPTSGLLKGEVEVDEVYYGGVKRGGGGGRGSPGKTIVIIAVEDHGKGAGRIRLARIPNVRRGTLHAFILETVEPGTTVITDGWQFYSGLGKLGYEHEVRQVSGSGKTADELLPHVHRVASLSKRWLLGTHQGSWRPEHLDNYLDEYAFASTAATPRTAASSSSA